MWALHVQKHFAIQGRVSGGCSWKGSAGSCSLPAVICQIISLQPVQMLLALRVSRLLEELTGATHECLVFPAWCLLPAAAQASMDLQLTHPAENSNFAG